MGAGTPPGSRKWLNIALWVVQVLLAVAFFFAGFGKATRPLAELNQNMAWTTAVPLPLTRFIGVCEMLGAIGLLVPALARIMPRLTSLAALGLALIMALAAVFHLFRGEYPFILPNVILGGLAVFIAWGRSKAVPINPR